MTISSGRFCHEEFLVACLQREVSARDSHGGEGRVIEVGLQIASIAYGAMLGVFLLGVLTRRAHQYGVIIGMICGFAMELYLWLGTHVPWTWWVPIGTTVTFLIGYLTSLLRTPKESF